MVFLMNFINLSLLWVMENRAVVWSSAISFSICFLWGVGHGKSITYNLSMSMICALTTLGIVSALDFLNLPEQAAPIFGVIIGLAGPLKIKDIAEKILTNHMDKNTRSG